MTKADLEATISGLENQLYYERDSERIRELRHRIHELTQQLQALSN